MLHGVGDGLSAHLKIITEFRLPRAVNVSIGLPFSTIALLGMGLA